MKQYQFYTAIAINAMLGCFDNTAKAASPEQIVTAANECFGQKKKFTLPQCISMLKGAGANLATVRSGAKVYSYLLLNTVSGVSVPPSPQEREEAKLAKRAAQTQTVVVIPSAQEQENTEVSVQSEETQSETRQPLVIPTAA